MKAVTTRNNFLAKLLEENPNLKEELAASIRKPRGYPTREWWKERKISLPKHLDDVLMRRPPPPPTIAARRGGKSLVKGSREAKARMAYLRSLRGKKRGLSGSGNYTSAALDGYGNYTSAALDGYGNYTSAALEGAGLGEFTELFKLIGSLGTQVLSEIAKDAKTTVLNLLAHPDKLVKKLYKIAPGIATKVYNWFKKKFGKSSKKPKKPKKKPLFIEDEIMSDEDEDVPSYDLDDLTELDIRRPLLPPPPKRKPQDVIPAPQQAPELSDYDRLMLAAGKF
jgi:hypothetical protein